MRAAEQVGELPKKLIEMAIEAGVGVEVVRLIENDPGNHAGAVGAALLVMLYKSRFAALCAAGAF